LRAKEIIVWFLLVVEETELRAFKDECIDLFECLESARAEKRGPRELEKRGPRGLPWVKAAIMLDDVGPVAKRFLYPTYVRVLRV
jgi:hypothetical protein